MSDEADRENQTEAASARRLQQARDEGQVPVGHDAVLVAGTAAAGLTLLAVAGSLRSGLGDLVAFSAEHLDRLPFASLPGLAVRPVAAALAVAAAAALAATAAGLAQTGGGFWPDLAAPDLSRLAGMSRLTRIVTKEFLLDLGLAIAKVTFIAVAAWNAVRDDLPKLPALLGARPDDQLAAAFGLVVRAGKPVLGVAIALAGAELALARFKFAKKMRMTKDELRREHKEDEGDPMIRGQRKKRHRELMKNQARKEVPRADALVVNPTHIAIAIRYRKNEGRAPRVTAKGKGALAELMRDLARENGIPIVQDVALARLLHRKVKVGREVPSQTYKAVATVLAFVYRVTGRRDAGVRA